MTYYFSRVARYVRPGEFDLGSSFFCLILLPLGELRGFDVDMYPLTYCCTEVTGHQR